MTENIAVVTEVHTPKLLQKVLPNRKAAAAATLVVAAGVTFVAAKFLKDRFDVDITATDASA